MTDAFARTDLVDDAELIRRPEAPVVVFADAVTCGAAADIFQGCICAAATGDLDLINWDQVSQRALFVRGDQAFCDRVADRVERFAASVLTLGPKPFNGADAESILASAVPPELFDDRLVRRTATDPGAPFEPHILERLAAMGVDSHERIRGRLRDEADFRRLTALDEAVKRVRDARRPEQQDGDSQVDRLLAIASQHECFRNEFEKLFVSFEVTHPSGGTYLDTAGVRSRKLRLSLMYRYYVDHNRAPGDAAVRVVIDTLEAKALYGGVIHPVAVRHCWHNGKIYIDLGTEDRKVIEIDEVDWRILDRPPPEVRFLRTSGTQPLPTPERVHPKIALAKLREVTRFSTERDEVITVGFILHSMAGKKPYAILLITGEPGAAKTAHVIVIGGLIDPRSFLKSTALQTKRDVYIAASTRGLVVLNNLSDMSRDVADGVCTSSEGGVDARRQLFTDEDESSIYAETPFLLASIGNIVAPYGDLSNRTLRVDLPPFPKNEPRLSESDFQAKFDAVAPAILGGMLSALSVGLRRLPGLVVKDLPRLAEFAAFVVACEPAFGWDEGTFLKAFTEAAEANADEVLLGDPVARTLQEFMEDLEEADGKKEWNGTATRLLTELDARVRKPERDAETAVRMARSEVGDSKKPADIRKLAEAISDLKEAHERVHAIIDAKWPKAPNALPIRLKAVGPQLKAAGIFIEWPTNHHGEKVLTVTYIYVFPQRPKAAEEDRPRRPHRPGDPDNENTVIDLEQEANINEDRPRDDPTSSPSSPRPHPRHNQPNHEPNPSVAVDQGVGAQHNPGLHNQATPAAIVGRLKLTQESQILVGGGTVKGRRIIEL